MQKNCSSTEKNFNQLKSFNYSTTNNTFKEIQFPTDIKLRRANQEWAEKYLKQVSSRRFPTK